jgi:hypothetical protein
MAHVGRSGKRSRRVCGVRGGKVVGVVALDMFVWSGVLRWCVF